MPRLAGRDKAHSARYWGYLEDYRLLSKKTIKSLWPIFFRNQQPSRILQSPVRKHWRWMHFSYTVPGDLTVSITVFANVYNRVSLLSVMSWLGRNFKQVTHLFAVQCSQYFAKKLKQESQLFSLLFPCTLSFWSCVLVCFHLFLKKHCTQYNIRPVMVYICEHMWLHSFSLSKQWAAE